MAAMFTDDPNELNKRYMPKDDGMYEDDDEEYIPEEELTEEERKLMNTIGSLDWKIILGWILEEDKEYLTLSSEERIGKTILAKLNSALGQEGDIAYQFRLALANSLYPDEAFYTVERLKKRPEEGINIPPEILDIIYKKAKEYKG